MKNKFLTTGFVAAALAIGLQTLASAQTSIALNVNWRADRKVNDAQSYQVNLWDAINPATATNASYLANLTTLKPGMVRVHAYEMYTGNSSKLWINTTTKTWDAAKIVQVYTAIRPKATEVMQNIPNWPYWMDANNDHKLDDGGSAGSPDQRQNYANWCASLVKILNVDNNFQVKYWEPLNETDDFYTMAADVTTLADIYNRCAIAMKAIDPTIIVGGPAAKNPSGNQANLKSLLTAIKSNLGFFSYHDYCSGAPGDYTYIYNAARNIGASLSNWARPLLNGQGVSSTLPIFIGESNMAYDGSTDYNTQIYAMHSMFGATAVALTIKGFGENPEGRGLQFFNDADNTFGLIKGTTTNLRGSGQVLALANAHMIGSSVGVTTANNGALDLYAVKSADGTKKTVMIVNTSDVYSDDPATTDTSRVYKAGTPYTAALTFSEGWPAPAATTSNYTIYTIYGPTIPPGSKTNTTSDVGYLSTSTGTYTSGTTLNIPINGNEIKFVVFSDVANDPNQIVRNPEADCCVASKTPNDPAMNNTELRVYGSGLESFLRFDVSNVGGSITSAKVRLYPTTVNYSADINRLDQATSNTWSETAMTWNTRPTTTLVYYPTWTNLAKGVRVEIDVTAAAQAAANATEKKLSFRISSASSGDNRYGSREALIESRPEFVIQRTPAQPVSLIASGDAYVAQGQAGSPTPNYGTATQLAVKLTGSGGDSECYYQFNLTGVTSASQATLSIYALAIDNYNRENWLGLAPSNWTESGIYWSNKPGSTADIGDAFVPATGQDVVKDVTAQVQAAIASGKISFRIYSKIYGGYNRYSSREDTTASHRPQLDITP